MKKFNIVFVFGLIFFLISCFSIIYIYQSNSNLSEREIMRAYPQTLISCGMYLGVGLGLLFAGFMKNQADRYRKLYRKCKKKLSLNHSGGNTSNSTSS